MVPEVGDDRLVEEVEGRTALLGAGCQHRPDPLAPAAAGLAAGTLLDLAVDHRWTTECNCDCCPPSVARTIAKLHNWAYKVSDEGVWVNLYGGNRLETSLPDGSKIRLTQETDYPWDGQIKIIVERATKKSIGVMLRIPGWAEGVSVKLSGQPLDQPLEPGTHAAVRRVWSAGDLIELDLPMPVRLIEAHAAAKGTQNKVAVMRGPLVYCLEAPVEEEGDQVWKNGVFLPENVAFTAPHDSELLGGVTLPEGTALTFRGRDHFMPEVANPAEAPKQRVDWEDTLYRTYQPRELEPAEEDTIPITLVPYPLGPGRLFCRYDAWNRLVSAKYGLNDGAEFEYDGLGRRIIKRTYQNRNLTETRHYYYNHLWQILEERVERAKTRLRDTPPERLYVWGLRGLNDLVLRDRDSNGDGTLDERLYAVQDANSNVVALMDTAGNVVERFCYDPYGQPLFLRNGKFEASSAFEWNILYAGYHYDANTGLYDVRRRVYHPTLGRWLQTDPLGYQDSLNVYQYAFSGPLTYVDPTGQIVISGTILLGLGIAALIGGALGGVTYAATTDEFKVSDFALYVGAGAAAGAVGTLAFFGAVAGLSAIGVSATYAAVAAGGVSGYAGGFTHAMILEGDLATAHQQGAFGALGGVVGGAVFARFGAGLLSTLASGAAGGFASGAVQGGLTGYAETASLWGAGQTALRYGGVGAVFGAGTALGGRLAGRVAGRIRPLPEQPPGLDPRATGAGKLMIGTRPIGRPRATTLLGRVLRGLVRAGVLSGRGDGWRRTLQAQPGEVVHHPKPLRLGGADIPRNVTVISEMTHRPCHPVGIRTGIVYY